VILRCVSALTGHGIPYFLMSFVDGIVLPDRTGAERGLPRPLRPAVGALVVPVLAAIGATTTAAAGSLAASVAARINQALD
jgi:hypothetical protein